MKSIDLSKLSAWKPFRTKNPLVKTARTRAVKELIRGKLPREVLDRLWAFERTLRPQERMIAGMERGTENMLKKLTKELGGTYTFKDLSLETLLHPTETHTASSLGDVVVTRSVVPLSVRILGHLGISPTLARELDAIAARHEAYELAALRKQLVNHPGLKVQGL